MSSVETSTHHANTNTNTHPRWKSQNKHAKATAAGATTAAAAASSAETVSSSTKAPPGAPTAPLGPRSTTSGRGSHYSTRFSSPRPSSHHEPRIASNAPGQQHQQHHQQHPPQHPRAAYEQSRRGRLRRFQQQPRRSFHDTDATRGASTSPAPPTGPASSMARENAASGAKAEKEHAAGNPGFSSAKDAKFQKKKRNNNKLNQRKSQDAQTDPTDSLDVSSLSLSVSKQIGTQEVQAKLDGGAAVTVKDVPHTVHTILPVSHLDFNLRDIRVSLPTSAATNSCMAGDDVDETVAHSLHKKSMSSISMADSVVSRSPSPARSPNLLSRDVSVTPPLIDRQSEDVPAVKQVEKKKSGAVIVDSSSFDKSKPVYHPHPHPTGPGYYGHQYPVYQPYLNDPALYPVSYDTTPALMPFPYMGANGFPVPSPHMMGHMPYGGSGPEDDKGMDTQSPMMAAPYMPEVAHGVPYGYYPYDPNGAYNYQFPPPF